MKRLGQLVLTLCIGFCLISPCYAAAESAVSPVAEVSDPFWIENFTPLGIASYRRGEYVAGTLVAAADLTALVFFAQALSASSPANGVRTGYEGLALIGTLLFGTLSYTVGRGIGLGGHAIQGSIQKDQGSMLDLTTDPLRENNFSTVPTLFAVRF